MAIQVRVVIYQSRVQVFVDGPLSPEQAKDISRQITGAIGQAVPFEVVEEPEQHKDGPDHMHVHEHGRHGHRHES